MDFGCDAVYAKDPYPSSIKRLKVLNMTEKGEVTNPRSNQNRARFDLARILRWLGISFIIVGWGIPLIIGILGPALPYSIGEPIRRCLFLINNEYRCTSISHNMRFIFQPSGADQQSDAV